MSFGVANIDRQTLKNNTVALAKAGKIFNVPVIYTLRRDQKLQRLYLARLLAVHPDVKPIERTSDELLGRRRVCGGGESDRP